MTETTATRAAMHISVVTIFPRMFDAVTEHGICARAIEKGVLQLRCWDPRDFTDDRRRAADDRPYGGGPGMLMKPAPLARAIDAAQDESDETAPVVYLSPQGERLTQALLAEFAEMPRVIFLAGRYQGVDQRVIDSRVDREVSLGDYVLAGGELAAMVLIEGVARLLPGVLGNELSARQDSFAGELLDCPQYTRPEVFEGREVPAVLLSGDHAEVRRWRMQQALRRTRERRPDLLAGRAPLENFRAQTESSNAYQPEKKS